MDQDGVLDEGDLVQLDVVLAGTELSRIENDLLEVVEALVQLLATSL